MAGPTTTTGTTIPTVKAPVQGDGVHPAVKALVAHLAGGLVNNTLGPSAGSLLHGLIFGKQPPPAAQPPDPTRGGQFAGPNGQGLDAYLKTMTPAAPTSTAVHSAPAEPTLLEQLQSSLPKLNLSDYLKGISEGNYTKPYDDAANTAASAAQSAVPAIQDLYKTLGQQQDAGNTDLQQQLAAHAQQGATDAAAAHAGMQGQTNAMLASLQAQGVNDPSLLASYGQAAQSRLDSADQTAQNRAALADRFSQIAGMDAAHEKSDLLGAQGAAQSNIQSALLDSLTKLGMGRATAEQAFNRDTLGATRNFQNDSRSNAMALYNAQVKAHDQAAKDAQSRAALVKSSSVPISEQFAKSYPQIAAKYPGASQVFEDITKAAKGTGPMGYAQAKRILDAASDHLSKGKYVTATGTAVAKRINPQIIDSWLQQHYSTDKTLDPTVAKALGL